MSTWQAERDAAPITLATVESKLRARAGRVVHVAGMTFREQHAQECAQFLKCLETASNRGEIREFLRWCHGKSDEDVMHRSLELQGIPSNSGRFNILNDRAQWVKAAVLAMARFESTQ